MNKYLYRTTIYKNSTNIIDLDIESNDSAKQDFEDNYKETAIKVTDINLSETVFIIDEDYESFIARIIDPLSWADVNYLESNTYKLLLLVE